VRGEEVREGRRKGEKEGGVKGGTRSRRGEGKEG